MICIRNTAKKKGEPVKDSYYRLIFRTEFNMDFHIPKTDRCNRTWLK